MSKIESGSHKQSLNESSKTEERRYLREGRDFRRIESVRDVSSLMCRLENLQQVKLPQNKGEKRILSKSLQNVSRENPLQIYVGSCPDYSHSHGLYTHRDLGQGVPLLTQTHLQCDAEFLHTLDSHEIPFVYTVMVADVEGMDETFCNKFTQGDQGLFLNRCLRSMEATQTVLNQNQQFANGVLKSSSFFNEFGFERFMNLQESYQFVLQERFKSDGSFHSRVSSDTMARSKMYKAMYAGVIDKMSFNDRMNFLATRTIRTMAQYLTLGKLIAEQPHPVIINHPTKNISVFNDRNKFALPEDDNRIPQPTIPVLHMIKEIY